MDENERHDRIGQRIFMLLLALLVILPAVLVFPFILLHYEQGMLLSDIVKISLGFLGGIGGGAFLTRVR